MRIQRAGLILAVAAVLVAACDAGAPSGPPTQRPATASAGPSTPAATSPAASPGASTAPAASPVASPKASGSPAASASTGPAPSGSIDPSLCAGSDANRQFFRDVAAQVTWAVYCPTLPKGWFVEAGTFRAASGGSMVISYKSGTGQRIELKEGAGCLGVPTDCGPYDTSLGTAPYGDLTGQIGKLASGYVMYVKPGLNPSWSATGTGLDEATFRSICAGLLKVAK